MLTCAARCVPAQVGSIVTTQLVLPHRWPKLRARGFPQHRTFASRDSGRMPQGHKPEDSSVARTTPPVASVSLPPQELGPAAHGAALRQLEAIEHALAAHVRLPGTRLRVGLDTALGRVPFAGLFAYTAGAPLASVPLRSMLCLQPSVAARTGNASMQAWQSQVPANIHPPRWR